MHQARQAFDVEAPFIVASEELVYGGRRFRRGEPFPSKKLGVSDYDLLQLWTAMKVDVAPAVIAETTPALIVTENPDTLTEAELEKLTAPTEVIRPFAAGGVIDTAPGDSQLAKFTVTARGPTVVVETPAQRDARTKGKPTPPKRQNRS